MVLARPIKMFVTLSLCSVKLADSCPYICVNLSFYYFLRFCYKTPSFPSVSNEFPSVSMSNYPNNVIKILIFLFRIVTARLHTWNNFLEKSFWIQFYKSNLVGTEANIYEGQYKNNKLLSYQMLEFFKTKSCLTNTICFFTE